MQLIRHLPETGDRLTAVAIGNFDGLHLGHQAVMAANAMAAREQALLPSVLTFEPHPRRFFVPNQPDFRLERLRDKLAGLRALGVSRLYMPRFDAAFAGLDAPEFLDQVLYRKLGARAVVTGADFVFGKGRGGNVALLQQWGAARQVRIVTVPPVVCAGTACSSSAIRAALGRGDMAQAALLLGRPYRLRGRVMHGDARGRAIGFPTANLHPAPGLLLPGRGVYAVRVKISDTEYSGVANIGVRPTVAVNSAPKLEVHLFDMKQDLYGKMLEVALVHKIRDEKKFDTMENLRAQIAQDAHAARDWLEAHV